MRQREEKITDQTSGSKPVQKNVFFGLLGLAILFPQLACVGTTARTEWRALPCKPQLGVIIRPPLTFSSRVTSPALRKGLSPAAADEYAASASFDVAMGLPDRAWAGRVGPMSTLPYPIAVPVPGAGNPDITRPRCSGEGIDFNRRRRCGDVHFAAHGHAWSGRAIMDNTPGCEKRSRGHQQEGQLGAFHSFIYGWSSGIVSPFNQNVIANKRRINRSA